MPRIKAKKEVRGMETINPAKREDLFAISATKTTIAAVIKVLIIRYNIILYFMELV